MAFASSLSYTQYIAGLVAMAHNKEFRHMQRAAFALLYDEGLALCVYEDDGDCNALGVVHDIAANDDHDYCLRHFNQIERSR